MGDLMDVAGVLEAIYDPVTNRLGTTVVAGVAAHVKEPDANAVWQNCFDAATNTVRVIYV